MDPNTLLTQLLETAVEIDDYCSVDTESDEYYEQDPADLKEMAEDLSAKVMHLHAWLSRGGVLPEAWAR